MGGDEVEICETILGVVRCNSEQVHLLSQGFDRVLSLRRLVLLRQVDVATGAAEREGTDAVVETSNVPWRFYASSRPVDVVC